jgi:hypothetical protein
VVDLIAMTPELVRPALVELVRFEEISEAGLDQVAEQIVPAANPPHCR